MTQSPRTRGCVICGEPTSSKSAKTCGSQPCRMGLVWHNRGYDDHDLRCSVYRCYNEAGGLLYVGRSIDPEKRWADHRRSSAWAAEVTRREVAWFDTVHAALCAESTAIARERPKHNVKATQSTSFHSFPVSVPFDQSGSPSEVVLVTTWRKELDDARAVLADIADEYRLELA